MISGASARASMGRRELLQHVGTFGLGAVSFGVLGLGLTGCTPSNTPSSSRPVVRRRALLRPLRQARRLPLPHLAPQRVPHPRPPRHLRPILPTATSSNPVPEARAWTGPQTGLPGEGKYIAWTVDDGADPEVVRAYAEFSRRTGTRLTFFINGQYPAFRQHRDLLLPLVKSGQLQIANHTYSHAALTSLTDEQIVQELTRNDEEIRRLFGVSSKPYFRPPYGYYDARVLAAAASCGFTRPVLWYGSLADSSNISSAEVYAYAEKYALAQHIVIGHLNYRGVVSELDRIRRCWIGAG